MKKRMFTVLTAVIVCNLSVYTQSAIQRLHRVITDPVIGTETITAQEKIDSQNDFLITGGALKDAGINWSYTDPASIGSKIQVSSATGTTFLSWWLNDSRVSLFGSTATPIWEQFNTSQWEFPIDMTDNGLWAAVGYNNLAQVYLTSSSVVYWELTVTGEVIGLKLNNDGSILFVAENNYDGMGNSRVSSYPVGTLSPNWQTIFQGGATTFNASDDGSKLVFCQYTGYNKMWVLDGITGNVIFSDYYKNQYPPAFSYDGSILLNGDYSGYAYLYTYNEDLDTYEESWNFKVGGGGTSVWVVGMAVSGDGSAVAVGTLVFLSGGGFEGEIYLFNSWSPVPLWVFSGAGDQVGSVDFSYDGSLLAAAGWGPLDNSKPDYFLFRKESNVPLFTILTPGSFNAVDLSPDGTLCAVTGKAVHARVMGNGGLLYNVNSNPGGGTLEGTVTLENTSDHSNVKIMVYEPENYFGYSQVDGSFEVKYIPEGFYSVTASKVGYYPQTLDGVAIVEGLTTTGLTFNLSETGNPPFALTATQGAGLSVELSWNAYDQGDILGFNIYRKAYENDFFPEDPMATVDNTTLNFSDTQILPLIHYFYAVTAIIEEGVESPYSNVASGWISSGYIIDEVSVYTGSEPQIDGTISPGEWDDAFLMDASDFLGKYDNTPNPVGSVTMYFKSNEELTELYVACINDNDVLLEDHDEVALYIDDNNDGSFPEPGVNSEGNYWAVYYASGCEIRYRPIYNTGGVGEVYYFPDPQIAVSDATGVIVYEFMIPIGSSEDWQIHPNDDNQSGLFMFTLDDPTAFDGYWPCWNQEIFAPIDYGLLTFDATDEIPVPPINLTISWINQPVPVPVTISWDQPAINDFSHFNLYKSDGTGNWEFLDSTPGTQFLYLAPSTQYTEFYVTTVDHAQQESDPSEIVVFDITTDVTQIQAASRIQINPNPASSSITLSMEIQEAGWYRIMIRSLDGRMNKGLFEGMLDAGSHNLHWNLEAENNLPAENGIYLVSVEGSNLLVTQKVVLIK